MPNCQEHEDCDLVCSECGSYYCQGTHRDAVDSRLSLIHFPPWRHVHRPDMPDDIEAYRNERAEEMP